MNTIPDPNAVWEVLRGIPDPEFGINIVDLGLIYEVQCSEGEVAVTMTLTTPSCPSGRWIYEGTKQAILGVPGVTNARVEMVFEPAWTPEMLTEAAQRQLGRID